MVEMLYFSLFLNLKDINKQMLMHIFIERYNTQSHMCTLYGGCMVACAKQGLAVYHLYLSVCDSKAGKCGVLNHQKVCISFITARRGEGL